MPYHSSMTLDQLRAYEQAGRMTMSFEWVEAQVKAGGKLIQECSSFNDPGDDWTAVWIEHTNGRKEQVAYWEGF